MMTLGVFGLPGVGKTTMIEHYMLTHPRCARVTGGELISRAKGLGAEDYDSLRCVPSETILENQRLIVSGFRSFRAETEAVVIFFDGHSVVSNGVESVCIPTSIIAALELNGMVFVSDEPWRINERRRRDTRRIRASRSYEELAEEQRIALMACEHYAVELRLELSRVSASDHEAFAVAVNAD